MILGIVNQTIRRKDDSLCATAAFAQSIDITFIIGVIGRQKPFPIVETVSANAFAWGIALQRPLRPAQFLGLTFCNVVIGQNSVQVQIKRHFLCGIVAAIGIQGWLRSAAVRTGKLLAAGEERKAER